jgi:hypothetical protein
LKTRFNCDRAGAKADPRAQREVELIKRTVRNAGGDKDLARNLVLKATRRCVRWINYQAGYE